MGMIAPLFDRGVNRLQVGDTRENETEEDCRKRSIPKKSSVLAAITGNTAFPIFPVRLNLTNQILLVC